MVAHVWQQSSGEGSDLVVLHGWGLNSNIWQPLLPYLTKNFRVHCIDLPGYGDSVWPANLPVSLGTYCDLLLPHLPPKFHLLGWSLGGLIATQLALAAPDRCQSLTTVASSPRFVESDDWPGMRESVLTLFQQQLGEDYQKTVARFLAIQAMGSPHARADAKQMRELVFSKPLPDLRALRGGLELLASCDLRDDLARLHCPVWRVYGQMDTLVPAAAADAVAKLIPESPSWVVPQAAHTPFLTAPEEFADRLIKMLPTG